MTIRRRVRLILTFFVSGIIALALLAGVGLYVVDRHAEEIGSHGFAAAAILMELDRRLHHLRIDQSRAMTAGEGDEGHFSARLEARRRAEMDVLLDRFRALQPPSGWQATVDMEARLLAYLDANEARAGVDRAGPGAAAAAGALDALYQSADEAIVSLMEQVRKDGLRHAEHVAMASAFVMALLGGICILLLAATVILARQFNRMVLQPLVAIKGALERLSAGDRDVEVGYYDRDDEIGALAHACDAFHDSLGSLALSQKAREQAEAEKEHLARHDGLTGLPNRSLFTSLVDEAMAGGAATPPIYVFVIGITGLRQVTDLYGSVAGDEVILEMARRLDAEAPEHQAARLETGRFALMVAGGGAAAEAARLGNHLFDTLSRPIVVGSVTAALQVRVGISVFPTDSRSSTELVRLGELAIDRAKDDAPVSFFETNMDHELRQQVALEAQLRVAVAEGQIVPWFQPVVEIATGVIVGVEMLARWQRGADDVVGPGVFIPAVERLGLMNEMTLSLLRQAFQVARGWPAEIRIAVNFSPSQLKSFTLAPRLLELLREEGFDPKRLELEITEDALLNNTSGVQQTLNALKAVGMKMAIDDFGMGYSSFFQLKRLTFDKLKIDQSFIRGMDSELDSRIVDAMIALASGLGMEVVAEGVEQEWMVRRLFEKGCRLAQGFYFSGPLPPDQIHALLARDGGTSRILQPAGAA